MPKRKVKIKATPTPPIQEQERWIIINQKPVLVTCIIKGKFAIVYREGYSTAKVIPENKAFIAWVDAQKSLKRERGWYWRYELNRRNRYVLRRCWGRTLADGTFESSEATPAFPTKTVAITHRLRRESIRRDARERCVKEAMKELRATKLEVLKLEKMFAQEQRATRFMKVVKRAGKALGDTTVLATSVPPKATRSNRSPKKVAKSTGARSGSRSPRGKTSPRTPGKG